jgi:hypothetical protein
MPIEKKNARCIVLRERGRRQAGLPGARRTCRERIAIFKDGVTL